MNTTVTVDGPVTGPTDNLVPADAEWMKLYDATAEAMNDLFEQLESKVVTYFNITSEQRELVVTSMKNQVCFRPATWAETLLFGLGGQDHVFLDFPDLGVCRIFRAGELVEDIDWVWAIDMTPNSKDYGQLCITPLWDSSSWDQLGGRHPYLIAVKFNEDMSYEAVDMSIVVDRLRRGDKPFSS